MENLKKDGIKYLLQLIKDYLEEKFLQIKNAILTVNGDSPDENGNVNISRVDRADNLVTTFRQNSTSTFIQRTSGGNAAIVSGEARLMSVYGNMIHEGYVPDVINISVQSSSEDEQITAKMTDKDTFLRNVPDSDVITITYSTSSNEWDVDPAFYGITVEGTPLNNDKIIIEYTAEVRGTISFSTPEVFVSTGWNLYDPINEYAKVVRYSSEYGYRIEGNFSSLSFATTTSGIPTTIVPVGNLFQVPSDGYVFVNGGDASTTAIFPTWSDWTSGYPGGFEEFTTSTIDLSSISMNQEYFPYGGMCAVGDVRDEISISQNLAYSRIERIGYSIENLITVRGFGRGYVYDDQYIYYVRQNIIPKSIDLPSTYDANDHGIEYFTETLVPAMAQTNYSMNIKNKLERDTVTISQQTLSPAEQAQIRKNIGAASADEVTSAYNGAFLTKMYSYKIASVSGSATKTITAENLGVAPIEGYTPVMAMVESAGVSYFNCYILHPVTTGTVASIRNMSSSAQTNRTINVTYLWVKDNLIKSE